LTRMPGTLLRDNNGSALVESALLLPLLFALLFGVYEFSWFFYQQHLAAIGVRDAARYLARVSNPCDERSAAWPIEQANARTLATTGSVRGNSARVKGWTAAMVVLRCTAINNPAGPTGLRAYRSGSEVVYVITASTSFVDPSLGFFAFLHLAPPVISVSHSERVVGSG
jgi:Flp pilus assembly protein TadG